MNKIVFFYCCFYCWSKPIFIQWMSSHGKVERLAMKSKRRMRAIANQIWFFLVLAKVANHHYLTIIFSRTKVYNWLLVLISFQFLLMSLLTGDIPKPTGSLDYKYTRSSDGDSKNVSHFWELGFFLLFFSVDVLFFGWRLVLKQISNFDRALGGGRSLVSQIDIAIAPKRLESTLVVLVLDLSKVYVIIIKFVVIYVLVLISVIFVIFGLATYSHTRSTILVERHPPTR